MKGLNGSFLIKPRIITNRSGYYFLRGYDYVLNRITENKIAYPNTFVEVEKPILNKVPSFNFKSNPEAANQDFVINEIKTIVQVAKKKTTLGFIIKAGTKSLH